jgi:hypothetical protein
MKRALAFVIAALLLCAALPAFGANLYAIIFANTEDEGIGCIYDVLHMGTFLKDAQKATGLTLKARIHLLKENVNAENLGTLSSWATVVNGWSKADLESEIKALTPTKDDTVIFYYSGHGGRMSNKQGKWPDMVLQNEALVDLQYPVQLVEKKAVQPRLLLAFGDCCNSYMDRSASVRTRSAKSTAALRDLFLASAGIVIASGSTPGQYSLGGSDGGVFTNAYMAASYNAMNTSWESVLKNAQILASSSSDGEQVPQFEVIPSGQAPTTTTTAATTQTTTTTPATTTQTTGTQASTGSTGTGTSGKVETSTTGTTASTAAADASTDEETDSSAFIPFTAGKASGTRVAGSSQYPFVELKAASVAVKGRDLIVTLDLASLPKKLVFNDKETPSEEVEYEWGAYIDVDGSGEPQYEVCLIHFKEAGARKAEDAILNACYAAVFSYENGDGEEMDAEVDATIDKNQIRITVSNYEDLFVLEKGAQVYFTALYYLGGESYIP